MRLYTNDFKTLYRNEIVTLSRKTLIGAGPCSWVKECEGKGTYRMHKLVRWSVAAWMALAGNAFAENYVVVELFTSQGCSSCPPADSILGELAEQDDVIALAWHVDYWDYLGWKDEFASPEYSDRQRAYARAKGERTIYTPQMVIGGLDHAIGSRPMKVAALIKKHAAKAMPVEVKLVRDGDTVQIAAMANGVAVDSIVQVVTFRPRSEVNIRRGENAGRTLVYHNVVQQLVHVEKWDGQGDYTALVTVGEDMPVAVMVQARGAGPILGATQLR